MPSKKKGKGSKLARMSDEERARYLEHRAELELEAKRRKQQLIAIFTKNKLKREEAFSRLNTAKINEQWRFVLRRIKCKELRDDLEYLWSNFDRVIESKNLTIKKLYKELEVANEDHKRLQEAHIQIMDEMFEKHKHRLMCLYNNYSQKVHEIESNDVFKLSQLKKNMIKDCESMTNIIFHQEKIVEDKLGKSRTHNAINLYAIEYLKEDATSLLINQTSKKMEKLWKELNKIISDYEVTTEDKRKQYEYLKEQDDIHKIRAAQYPKLHDKLQSSIENLKEEICILSNKRNSILLKLENQAKQMTRNTWQMKQRSTQVKTKDALQLKKLSVISNNMIKNLKKIYEKGSTLLLLIKMCSNLEPLPFTFKKYFIQSPESSEEKIKISETFEKMEKFWMQHNYIKAENILMKQDCEKLSMENKQLRQTLRTYLITISRTPTVRPLTSIST